MGTNAGWQMLLDALDSDATRAAAQYLVLRRQLIAMLSARGLSAPEDLADEAFERVARRLSEGVAIDLAVAAYVHGVARRIAFEASRRRCIQRPLDCEPVAETTRSDEDDAQLAQLERCLGELPAAQREALIRYEAGRGIERIQRRKALAAELGIPLNALRIRMHRVRARLVAMMQGGELSAAGRAAI